MLQMICIFDKQLNIKIMSCPEGYTLINGKCIKSPTPPAPNDLVGENPPIQNEETNQSEDED